MAEVEGEVRTDELDAEAQARRRAALAQIRQWGDPALRLAAREVEEFGPDLRRLADRMTRLMRDAHGVGLAATQVGVLQRVAIVQPGADEEPIALVNPRIVERGDETSTEDEGCLSLRGVVVPVERATSLTVEARDPDGAELRLELDDYAARVAQHELDHLDGVLILDRTTPEARREALGTLRPDPVLGPLG